MRRHAPRVRRREAVQDHRRVGPQSVAMFQVQVGREFRGQHDGVDARATVLVLEILGERRPRVAAHAPGVRGFVEKGDRTRMPLVQRRLHRTVDGLEGRQVGVGSADDQHVGAAARLRPAGFAAVRRRVVGAMRRDQAGAEHGRQQDAHHGRQSHAKHGRHGGLDSPVGNAERASVCRLGPLAKHVAFDSRRSGAREIRRTGERAGRSARSRHGRPRGQASGLRQMSRSNPALARRGRRSSESASRNSDRRSRCRRRLPRRRARRTRAGCATGWQAAREWPRGGRGQARGRAGLGSRRFAGPVRRSGGGRCARDPRARRRRKRRSWRHGCGSAAGWP